MSKLITDNVLSAIGNTPLVRLSRVMASAGFHLYAKLEALNPGGSTKDRPAFSVIKNGIDTGVIRPGTVIIESSSGNMGIGLSQACAYYGLRFICVIDPKTTQQNIRLMKAYDAEVDLVETPDPCTGEFLQARIRRVEQLLQEIPNSFWPNQYANKYNPIAHYKTMSEINEALGGSLDYLFCPTSTCGTLRGCSEFIRDHGLKARIIAVDAIGSVIFGGKKAKRLIPGHGAAVTPELYQHGLAYDCVHVSDLECIIGCRRLVRQEAILAGGSSGAVLMAVERYRDKIEDGATCAMLFPDRGERYLDTIYSDEWVTEHFGEVSNNWQQPREELLCATAI
ncbi:MAG TPA: 2,3-diaminopropionate biosynthesis protein SbnA [Blastocatellia bacterium]|nr:2,3-diaminopropionate biosynthesis protein SbnA [Blastocatellia bacterium]